MTTPVFGSSSAEPPRSRTGPVGSPVRPPGRKAVRILLAPVTGRAAAFAIAGLPLAVFLIIGITASGGGSSSSPGNNGRQYQPFYPVASPTYATDVTPSPLPSPTDSAFDYPSPSGTDAGGFGAASPTDTSSASPSPGATGPATVVLAAYGFVNSRNYQAAYNLGLAQPGQTYQDFVNGYKTTQSDTVTITDVTGGVVHVSLAVVSTDGTQHTYSGTYIVFGGVITSGSLRQVN